MKVIVSLPTLEPDTYQMPEECLYEDCHGMGFDTLQEVAKPIRDTLFDTVNARRCQCQACGRTFRVYPVGVSRDQFSNRLKGLAVLLHIMGMSYGAVELALEALGSPMSRAAIYRTVQSAQQTEPTLQRNGIRLQITEVLAAIFGVTGVETEYISSEDMVSVHSMDGTGFALDVLNSTKSEAFLDWVNGVSEAVGAKTEVAPSSRPSGESVWTSQDEFGREMLAGRRPSVVEIWLTQLRPQLAQDADDSLCALGVTAEQALADCDQLLQMLRWWPAGSLTSDVLRAIRHRYMRAERLHKGINQHRPSLAYQMCLLTQDYWGISKEFAHAAPNN